MTVQLSGPTMALEPGDERDFPQDEAVRLVAAGFAVPVVAKVIEVALKEPSPEVRKDTTAPVVEVRRKSKRR
jgi:hypothetical protein